MTTPASLAQQTVKILRYINEEAITASPAADDSILNALYHMHKLSPGYVVITCPVRYGSFFYISDNCENVFGYDAQSMAAHCRELSSYIAQIHDADFSDLKECISWFEAFIKTQPPQDLHQIRTVFHYRFRSGDGQYRYLLDERASVLDANGTTVHYSLIRRASPSFFSGVKLEIFRQNVTLQKLLEYKPAQERKLSNRESQLVTLIKQGFTTKEIAGQLSISHNTVRNIKSKMFEKFNVSNAIELLNAAG